MIVVETEGINPQDKIGMTPLHLAAQYNHEQVCKLILSEISLDKNPKDESGRTPLHLAAKYGRIR